MSRALKGWTNLAYAPWSHQPQALKASIVRVDVLSKRKVCDTGPGALARKGSLDVVLYERLVLQGSLSKCF